jgi:phosphate starvation-inducible PhoH-like protein
MRTKKTGAQSQQYDSSSYDNAGGSSRKSKLKNMAPLYKPRSDNQRQYVSHLANASVPIVFGIGPAGCGKTLFACITAIEGLKRGDFQKIVLTRPIVPVEEEELGFLPGTLVKKMDPWTRPLMDIFLEYYPQHEIDFMLGAGVIEISPLAYMRGRTFKRCFIIADEMQNSSPGQMLMLTTRIGDASKMVITGDLKQSDRSLENGLLDIMTKIKTYKKNIGVEGIEMVEMNRGDIERSPIVSKILEIFNHKPKPLQPLQVSSGLSHNETIIIDNKNDSTIKPSVNKLNNDAALIPLSDISKFHF